MIALAPALAAGAGVAEIRHLCEFSIRSAASLAREDAWRGEIAFLLGAIFLELGDDEGARLCVRAAWPAEGADGLQAFTRAPDIVGHCRREGLSFSRYEHLLLERMDGRVSADLDPVPAFLCRLPGASVLGQSFLPATREGVVFVEHCIEGPGKLSRLDGIVQMDTLRLASGSRLWARFSGTQAHAGRHVLIGNHDNIGHWLLSYFARTRLLEEMPALGDAKIVVGENLKPLQAECLARVGIGEDRLVRLAPGVRAQFEELWVPSMIYGAAASHVLYWARDAVPYVRRALGVHDGPARGRRRVFLSRRGARWRRMLNEDEISALLAGMGFEEVDPGRLSLQQQIDLAAETEAIVGCFGAGMNFHLFAGEGVPVLQIQLEESPRMNIHVPIARALRQPFHALVAEVPQRLADTLRSDFRVPPQRLRGAVAAMLDGLPH